ncbi:type II toxin-antitoxin system VapC family toxin [Candidatus Electrothrix sp.]|uniref:type II toxin-antitoxin system VapC family toxin n=1 Tax=Candidatus Electrothrix sp. TaxID=2170559 RepID=UPI004055B8E8
MILLDTHIWVRWLLPDDPLPDNLTKLIKTADDALAVSSISCWEVVLLERFHRIKLPLPVDEWLTEALSGSDIIALPIDENIARLAGRLPYHHKDPADRFIIATSIINNARIISLDSWFPSYTELADLLITGS